LALLLAAVGVLGCEAGEGAGDASDSQADASPGQFGTAALSAEVRLANDAFSTIVPELRSYATSGSALARGDLWAQVCADASCDDVLASVRAADGVGVLLSTGFTTSVAVEGLPAGDHYVRWVLDSEYSQSLEGAWSDEGGPGHLDLLSLSQPAEASTAGGQGPLAKRVTLSSSAPTEFGEVVMGHVLLQSPRPQPSEEPGRLLALSTGGPSAGGANFRNRLRDVNLQQWSSVDRGSPKIDGADFSGDLCALLPGPSGLAFAVGVVTHGAYVFGLETATGQWSDRQPVFIPHPDCAGDTPDTCPADVDPERTPAMCRGVFHTVGGRDLLLLIESAGAGSAPTTQSYPLAVVDVTDFAILGGALIQRYRVGEHPLLPSDRVFRAVGAWDNTVYLVEPSWSQALIESARSQGSPAFTRVWQLELAADGSIDFDGATYFGAGTADDDCGSQLQWSPALTVIARGGSAEVWVGTDTSVRLHNTAGGLLQEFDTSSYGGLITSFATAPDGAAVYALPACKSYTEKSSVPLGLGGDTTALDRHAVAIFATGTGGAVGLLTVGRDHDGDGDADAGIDLEYLHLKQHLLRWCPTCTGVVPPTAYTGPRLVSTGASVVMWGAGSAQFGASSSGLGQVGDLGVFDVTERRGAVFRDFDVWSHGPSARWGFPLAPESSQDLSVGDVIYVAP
jgi:hypothetical protein